MKYLITESQYQNLKEQFDFEGEENLNDGNPFIGTQSSETLTVIDLLVKQGIIDLELINVYDDVITIFAFPEHYHVDYFMDNQIKFEVDEFDGEIHVNVEGDDEDEGYPLYHQHLHQIFKYIREVAKKTPSINWYIEGEDIEDY